MRRKISRVARRARRSHRKNRALNSRKCVAASSFHESHSTRAKMMDLSASVSNPSPSPSSSTKARSKRNSPILAENATLGARSRVMRRHTPRTPRAMSNSTRDAGERYASSVAVNARSLAATGPTRYGATARIRAVASDSSSRAPSRLHASVEFVVVVVEFVVIRNVKSILTGGGVSSELAHERVHVLLGDDVLRPAIGR